MGLFDGVIQQAQPMFNELKQHLGELRDAVNTGTATDANLGAAVGTLDSHIGAMIAQLNKLDLHIQRLNVLTARAQPIVRPPAKAA